MKRKILRSDFFSNNAVKASKCLLGKYIVRKWREGEIALPIFEAEAYDGFKDLASHASSGKTARNIVMFGPPGFWYVYFTYGMHWMINIVTGESGYPSAVLIRGAGEIAGPARLAKFLHVTGAQNKKFSCKRSGLWIEDRGLTVKNSKIKRLPRIGVDYAGEEWAKKPYRFLAELD